MKYSQELKLSQNSTILSEIGTLKGLKPLTTTRVTIDRSLISEMQLILYSSNLCLFSARILRDEINVPNRNETLNAVTKEISKLYSLLSKDDYYLHSTYTKKDTKKFFKDVGLKPRHINIDKFR